MSSVSSQCGADVPRIETLLHRWVAGPEWNLVEWVEESCRRARVEKVMRCRWVWFVRVGETSVR